ncbi:hypothetical protein [Arenicella sp. 4NH20-0111]|uniref:hypothetical protein n=1 Tax=Arenicella sp. 4NH20-0111 TaxID=3127648 RepID=UPI00333FECD9
MLILQKPILSHFLACSGLLFTTPIFAQQAHEHGHGAMQIFDSQGMSNTPQWVMIWIGFMLISFLGSIAFAKNHPEARWVLGGFIAGMILGSVVSTLFGIPSFSGFIALMHVICWSPALFILLKRRPFLGPRNAFSIWSGVMTFVIIFSFIFDIRDAAIFLSNYR